VLVRRQKTEGVKMFKQYRRKQIAELRDLQPTEDKHLLIENGVSVSKEDLMLDEEEFRKGKVARNPKNHNDEWYVARKYFEDNFEEIS
jgi:hypothetical protein